MASPSSINEEKGGNCSKDGSISAALRLPAPCDGPEVILGEGEMRGTSSGCIVSRDFVSLKRSKTILTAVGTKWTFWLSGA